MREVASCATILAAVGVRLTKVIYAALDRLDAISPGSSSRFAIALGQPYKHGVQVHAVGERQIA